MTSTNDTWCVLPWTHLCVRTDNNLKPCCRYLSDSPRSEMDVDLDIIAAQGIDAMNSPKITAIREKMLKGETLPGCKKCYVQEEHADLTDRASMRQYMNSRFTSLKKEDCTSAFDAVRFIEMSVDNICNLQCKMCSSMFSSRLINRDKFLGNPVHKKLEPNFSKFDNIDLTKLECVKILGGEPFITPNFVKFLDYLIARANPANIVIEIASNATALPSDEILEKLNLFKMLYIHVSLDTYSAANDYQRYGSSHKDIFKNAVKYGEIFSNVYVSFHAVISILNANELANSLDMLIKKYKYHVSVDFVRDPEHLSLLYAPPEYIEWILECNQHNNTAYRILQTFVKNANFDTRNWHNFLENVDKLDGYYNTNIEDYNPDLCKFLNNYGYRSLKAKLI